MDSTRTRTRWAGGVAAVCAAVALAGCGSSSAAQPPVAIGSADPFPASSTAPGASTSTTAPTTAPADPTATATTEAQDTLTRYLEVYNQLATSTTSDLGALDAVTSGAETVNVRNDLLALRTANTPTLGDSTVLRSSVLSADVAATPTTVSFSACVSAATFVGQTPVPPQDRAQQQVTFYLTNPSWPDAAAWRVSDTDRRGEACTA